MYPSMKLDMTGCEHLYGSLMTWDGVISKSMRLSPTASVGIGPNKFIAKLA